MQRGRKMLKEMLLECCHFEFDRRGNVIDYNRNSQCANCCEANDDDCSPVPKQQGDGTLGSH